MYNEITIGYLSWKRHDILKQTLKSHKENSLFDLIPKENRIIFFQEISEADIKIANDYECKYFGNDKNIGILNAFIELVTICNTEYFIFCENDWNLVEDKKTTELVLTDCLNILHDNKSDLIRLRHRKIPGDPMHSKPSDVDKWLKCDVSNFPYKLESLSWLSFPNKVYNNLFDEFNENFTWYTTGLKHQKWSNNIFIVKTEYLKNIILPLIQYFINDNEKYSGLEDILVNYNKYIGINNDLDNIIFKYKNIRISGGEGLFTHKDKI